MGDSETPGLGTYLRAELLRYKEKGVWLLLGVLIYAVAYGLAVPRLLSALFHALETLRLPTSLHLTLAIMIAHTSCYLCHCLILQGITYMGWSERYRCNPTGEWPWNEDKVLVSRTYLTLMLNFLVLIPATTYVSFSTGYFDFPGGSVLPSVWEIYWQLPVCMCAEDAWSFTFHSISHHRVLYRYVHKKHHEYITSIGLAAEYVHPCELIFINIVRCT